MKAWKFIPWILAVIVLALAIVQANGVQPVEASKLLTKLPTQTDNCMAADCPAITGYVCTANDVTVTLVETYDVDDPCSYIGDTGKYVFLAQIVAGAQSRYDVSWWIALDGANALTGASCYSDFIRPPLQSSGLSTTLPLYGPYWDLEYLDNGATDGCGDVVQDQYNYEQVGTLAVPVILNCTTDVMDGSINVCVSWDNQTNNNCNTTTGTEENGCPNTKSKCNCEDVPFRAQSQRDRPVADQGYLYRVLHE